MPCENCDCCRCQEDDEDHEDYDTSLPPPRVMAPVARPVPAPEVWKEYIGAVYQKYGTQTAINLPALCAMVLQFAGIQATEYQVWEENLRNYVRNSSYLTITKGKGGGVRLTEAARIALEIKKKAHLNDTYNGIKKAIEETLQTHRGAWVSHEALKDSILTKCGISEYGLGIAAFIKDGLKDGWLHCNGSVDHLAYMLTSDFQARVAAQLAAVPDAAEAHVAQVMKDREEWDHPKACAQGNDPSFGETVRDMPAPKRPWGHEYDTVFENKPVDNYTCKCGNKKLSTLTDKSCWSCGEPVKA
jgi:hypothetical protein